MKILLIDTPSALRDRMDPPRAFMPVALLYLASILERQGYCVGIYDPKLSASLFKTGDYFYFGDSLDIVKQKIKSFSPDIVGISVLFSRDFDNALKVASVVKEVNKDIKVIMGGAHPSCAQVECLSNPYVDIAVLGEGERTIIEILQCIKNGKPLEGVEGIAYKKDGKVMVNEPREFIQDLDELPLPAYHLADMERYFALQRKGFAPRPFGGKRSVSIITSRGCPYNCVFCPIHLTMGRKWRAHSAEYVLAHIKLLVEIYNAQCIQFEDDTLVHDRIRFEKIIDGILENNFKISWGTPNGVRADTINDPKLLEKMKNSGCAYINIGVESGQQKVLSKIITKNLSLDAVKSVARLCKKLNIQLSAYYVVGFPGETMDDIRVTLEFALELDKKYNVYPYVNYAIPFLGTRLHTLCKEKGYLTEEVNTKSLLNTTHFRGKGLIRTKEFNPQILKKALVEFHHCFIKNRVIKMWGLPRFIFKDAQIAFKNPHLARRILIGR